MNNNLSVMLIAHNEEATIEKMIEGLLKYYSQEILELLIVDDASTDRTASLAESWIQRNKKIRLIRRTPPCGVGRALKTGFQNIGKKADYVLSMDSDFIDNIIQVRLLIEAMENHPYDGVIGSRFIKGSRLIHYPRLKKIMNRLFHMVIKILFPIKQKDLTNNFKLYKTAIVRSLPWQSPDFAMNAETGIFPILSGYNIGEVPVFWAGRDARMGKSKFRLFKVGGGYLRVIASSWKFSRTLKKKFNSQIP